MNESVLERYAPLTGILAVVLTIVGAVIDDQPDFLADGDKIADYLVDDTGRALGSGVVWLLAAVPLLWFVGVLWSRLRRADADAGRLAATVAGGGVVGVALWVAGASTLVAGALRADDDGEISSEVATVLSDAGNVFWGAASPIGFGVMLLAVGVTVLRYGRVLPGWLGWASVVFAVWAFIPPISWAFMLVGFNVWLVVVAVLLIWGRPAAEGDRDVAPVSASPSSPPLTTGGGPAGQG